MNIDDSKVIDNFDARNRIGTFKKGHTPWNKGKTGFEGYWKGKKRSPEFCKMMSDLMKDSIPFNKGKTFEEMYGKERALELKKEHSEKVKGYKHTKDAKRRISETMKGKPYLHRGKTWEEIHGIEKAMELKQNLSEKFSGENHPLWQGGISKKPYPFEFDDSLKFKIRQRDNFTCQLCGYTEEQLGYTLSIHHIDYDKENIDIQNLITLCKSGNSKVNFNRKYWKEALKEKCKRVN